MAKFRLEGSPSPHRVVVDPNSFARRDPALSVVRFKDYRRGAYVGDPVLAVQPDDDGTEGVAPGVVEAVDFNAGLIYIRVNWDQFKVVDQPRPQPDQHALALHGWSTACAVMTAGNAPSSNRIVRFDSPYVGRPQTCSWARKTQDAWLDTTPDLDARPA